MDPGREPLHERCLRQGYIFQQWTGKLRINVLTINRHLPNLGAFLPQRGLKWSVRQILPPLYIWKVLSDQPARGRKVIFFHLRCFPVQLWQSNLRTCHWVSHRDVELHIELVLQLIVIMPALSEPPCTLLVRLKSEPVIVCFLVVRDIPEESYHEVRHNSKKSHLIKPMYSSLSLLAQTCKESSRSKTKLLWFPYWV